MAYASISHVQALNSNRTFTSSTKPSDQQVAGYLDQVSVELDSLLQARGYQLPVPTTATSARKLLEMAAAKGAYSMAETAAANSPFRDAAQKDWQRTLDMLSTGQLEPVDLDRNLPGAGLRAGPLATSAFGMSTPF